MTQYKDLVAKRRLMIQAEAWGEKIKEHYYQKDEGYFITYNSGKVIKVEDDGNKLIDFGMSVEELIDQYVRFGNENK